MHVRRVSLCLGLACLLGTAERGRAEPIKTPVWHPDAEWEAVGPVVAPPRGLHWSANLDGPSTEIMTKRGRQALWGNPVYRLSEEDGKRTGSGPAGQAGPVSLAAGGKTYLMAWCNRLPGGRGAFGAAGNKAVNAALFNASGEERIKTLNIGGGNRQVVNPEVCWDGEAFVAVWHDLTKAPKRPVAVYDAVYFSRISPAGELVGEAALLAGTPEAPAMSAAAASDGAGTTLLVYEKHPDRGDVPIKIGFRLLSRR